MSKELCQYVFIQNSMRRDMSVSFITCPRVPKRYLIDTQLGPTREVKAWAESHNVCVFDDEQTLVMEVPKLTT